MSADCLFCKIIQGQIPSRKVFEDSLVYAFEDISPKAPVHVLFCPKEHFASAIEITSTRETLVGHVMHVAAQVAKAKGLEEGGYRLIANTGPQAGQTVFHLHVHLLGGRPLAEMG